MRDPAVGLQKKSGGQSCWLNRTAADVGPV